LCVECPSWDELTSYLLGGVVGLPEGDIHIIPDGEKYSVVGSKARHIKNMAPCLNPPLPAFIGLGYVDWFSGCSARLSEGCDLFDIDTQYPSLRKWVYVLISSQLFLFGGRDPLDIIECSYIIRIDVV
jgi:hypothetical protein